MKQVEYFLRPGRQRGGVTGPGILCWKGKYEMLCTYKNVNGTEFTYRCKYISHPSFKCQASCKLIKTDEIDNDIKFIISTPEDRIIH